MFRSWPQLLLVAILTPMAAPAALGDGSDYEGAIVYLDVPAPARQESSRTPEGLRPFVETFDDAVTSALGGIVKAGRDGAWTVSFTQGGMLAENTTDNSAVRYYDLTSLPFPGGSRRSGTDGAAIGAEVHVLETQNGGAGVMVGYPGGGDYWLFGIGARGQFQIFRKQDGRLNRFEMGDAAAIVPNGSNRLFVQEEDGRFVFTVNEVEVFSIEAEALSGAPVGFAVLGRGRYLFDSVTVNPAGWEN